jgi:hypothetical protein
MELHLLRMEQGRRFRGFHLYMDSGPEEIQEFDSASGRVLSDSFDMGDSRFVMRTKREQYHDSRLSVLPKSRHSYMEILCEVVGCSVVIWAVFVNAGNWKANILFALAALFIVAKIGQLLMPFVRKYFKD